MGTPVNQNIISTVCE